MLTAFGMLEIDWNSTTISLQGAEKETIYMDIVSETPDFEYK